MSKSEVIAKVEQSINDMAGTYIDISASKVADHVVKTNDLNVSADQYEYIRRIADDSLARRFDPLITF